MRLNQELGLEGLEKTRWYRKLRCFFKILRNQSSKYIFNIISDNIPQFKVKHNFFQNTFFSFVAVEWNKLDQNVYKSENQEKTFEIYTSFWKQCFQMP